MGELDRHKKTRNYAFYIEESSCWQQGEKKNIIYKQDIVLLNL